MYRHDCRGCRGTNLEKIVSLGMSPMANNLMDNDTDECELFPLEVMYCSDCHNCQLSYVVPAEKMFDNYLYVSSTTKSMRDHFSSAANKFVNRFSLKKDDLVIDIGSNDGVALKPLKEMGMRVLGIDPAQNIVDIANENGIESICGYFDRKIASSIRNSHGKAKLVTASNVFAHADDLEEITLAAFDLLEQDGSFVVEVQYLFNTITDLTFDNIYHEHVNYWSVLSITNFFKRLGFYVYNVEQVNTHGGSIRVFVSRRILETDSVTQHIDMEKSMGLHEKDTYLLFGKMIENAKKNVNDNLKKFKDEGRLLVGYGSPAKATTSLNYFDIRSDIISYIVEDNSLKHNKLIPNIKIPIHSKDKLHEDVSKNPIVIVMAWNFFDEIKKNNMDLIEKGIEFINVKDLEKVI